MILLRVSIATKVIDEGVSELVSKNAAFCNLQWQIKNRVIINSQLFVSLYYANTHVGVRILSILTASKTITISGLQTKTNQLLGHDTFKRFEKNNKSTC